MIGFFLHCIIRPIFVPETTAAEPIKPKVIKASKILDKVKSKTYLKPPDRLLHVDIQSKIGTGIENNIVRQAVQGKFGLPQIKYNFLF